MQCCNGAAFHCTVVTATSISVPSRLHVCLHQFMLTCIRSFLFFSKTAAFAKAYPTLGSADSFNLYVSASGDGWASLPFRDLLLSRPRGKPAKDGSMLEMFQTWTTPHAPATAAAARPRPPARKPPAYPPPPRRSPPARPRPPAEGSGIAKQRKAEIQLTTLFNANGVGVPPVSVEPRGLAAVRGSVRRSVLNGGGSSTQPDGTMGDTDTLDRPQRTVSRSSSV